MHIKKFTQDYTRRYFLESMARGAAGAGVLMPLWDAISNSGDIRAAYPDEALDLETYSKGAVKAGDQISAANVDAVKDLLDPIAYIQIKEQGRVVNTRPTTTDIRELNPLPYTEATIKNQGLAQFDAKGNVVTKDGKPWIGGNPFPKAQTAEEILAGHVLSWGRLDQVMYPVYEWDLDADGNQQYHYQFVWIEYAAVARTVIEPKPYMPGHEDKLRYNTVLFTYPGDVSGTSLLNVWAYDQTKFPDFNGYMPAFKRVRRFPTNQRFEPIIPGSTFFISDAWMMGDPYMTWGNFKFVGKAPLLANVTSNWNADDPNWIIPRVGGKSGKKFFLTTMELVPETLIVDLEPTGYPRAPYSKKRIWFDARTLTPMVHITYDRRGQIWKQWEGGFARYQTADGRQWPESGEPYWSFCIVHSHDIQSNYMSLLQQVQQIEGGLSVRYNDPSVYENFCTLEAIRRLGT